MSSRVTRCEVCLAQTVALMHAALVEVTEQAPPCFVTAEEANAVDRAAVELEDQRRLECIRIGKVVDRLNAQFQMLEATVLDCLCDAPLPALDDEIDALNAENLTLADQIVAAYDEAAALAARIESGIMSANIPAA